MASGGRTERVRWVGGGGCPGKSSVGENVDRKEEEEGKKRKTRPSYSVV